VAEGALRRLAGNLDRAFSRTLFMQVPRVVQRGRLTLTFPDGSRRVYEGREAGPVAEARIHSEEAYRRLVHSGELGLGESYMDGLWDTDDLTALLTLGIINRRHAPRFVRRINDLSRWPNRKLHLGRPNSLAGSRRNIQAHYDLSNELFALFLDETMTYSCAMFEHDEESLADAQRRKYDVICRKADIRTGDRVLEIGCGWGGFALHAAEHYGCSLVSTTISREQYGLAARRISEAGLAGRIELQLVDYRELRGTYDKIVTIEMFEAVGAEYFSTFFEKCDEVLQAGGRMVMQTIAVPERTFEGLRAGVNWMQKYIFPGGMLPSLAAIDKAIAGTQLMISGVEDIGPHYVRTLREWRRRFEERLEQVRALGFDERFERMWRYYLCSAEAGFATRSTSDLQVVFDKV
jgi:cyclopropane-fatty-acyl-phospholipid synthase